MKLRFETATAAHARLVAENMRESDAEEVRCGWGQEPAEAIMFALSQSPRYARTCFYGLEPLAIYGLAWLTLLGESAEAWCFGTTSIDRHPIVFARASRLALASMYRHARTLTNLVPIADGPAVRWLEWLGAEFPDQPYEPRGRLLFAQFVLSSKGKAQCQRG